LTHKKNATEAQKDPTSEDSSFEMFANPEINRKYAWLDYDIDSALDKWDVSALVEKHGEAPVREKFREMVKAYARGMVITPLLQAQTPGSISMVHLWVGANFPLFRHSHPASGDCLYYVVAGEIVMGRKHLGPGSGFLVPSGMPYKYTGGPDGAEVLEIRVGHGEAGAPGLRILEQSLDSIQQIIDDANEHNDKWQAPEKIGDTPPPA
jgi:hypothetical protein